MKCINCQANTKSPKFCSKSCAATYNNKNRIRSNESKQKTSKKMKKLFKEGKIIIPYQKGITNRGSRWAKKPDNNWIEYQKSARFYTPYYILKQIDNFQLVEKYGWYHPIRNNNPLSASRDHLYSVCDGWKQKIPIDIISHPANCKIVSIQENKSKGKKSSITLEELYLRIKNWSSRGDSNSYFQSNYPDQA